MNKKDEWILDKYNLPDETFKRVLVTDGKIVTVAWLNAKGMWAGWQLLNDEFLDRIIAWKELPPPPKK